MSEPPVTDPIILRPARPGDERTIKAALVALHDFERTLSDTHLPGAQTVEAYYDCMMIGAAMSGAVLIAEAGGAFAGFAACIIVHDNQPQLSADANTYGLICDIYVEPQRRGSGVAQILLEAAVAHLKEQGMTRIRITALAGNDAALAAYRKCGFEVHEVVMEKRV